LATKVSVTSHILVKKGPHREERSAAFKPHAPPVSVGVIPWAFEWHMGVQARDVHKHIAVYKQGWALLPHVFVGSVVTKRKRVRLARWGRRW
jgi:hypothetical protein